MVFDDGPGSMMFDGRIVMMFEDGSDDDGVRRWDHDDDVRRRGSIFNIQCSWTLLDAGNRTEALCTYVRCVPLYNPFYAVRGDSADAKRRRSEQVYLSSTEPALLRLHALLL